MVVIVGIVIAKGIGGQIPILFADRDDRCERRHRLFADFRRKRDLGGLGLCRAAIGGRNGDGDGDVQDFSAIEKRTTGWAHRRGSQND